MIAGLGIAVMVVGGLGYGRLGNVVAEAEEEHGGGHGGEEEAEAPADMEKDLDVIKKQNLQYIQRQHFHEYLMEEMPQDPNQAICFHCHGPYPHQNAKKTRSMLNMHCVFAACETCHYKPAAKERARVGFRWFDGSDAIQASERHYGTTYDPVSGRVLMESGKTLFKITPYLEFEGRYYMVNLRLDSPEAQEFVVKRKEYSPQEQAAIKSKLHANIETKGYECGQCHSVDNPAGLNYKRLGFDNERQKDLTGLSIVGMIEKYQRFYIPDIFKQEKLYSLPEAEEKAEK